MARVRVSWDVEFGILKGEVVAVTVVVMWETGCCELILGGPSGF